MKNSILIPNTLIMVLLLVVSPIGLYLLFKKHTNISWFTKILAALFFIIVNLLIVMFVFRDNTIYQLT